MICLANAMVTLYVHASIYTTIKEYSRIGNHHACHGQFKSQKR